MKRRPLILAAVVTVAALACVVPVVWWDVWLWVAYEERVSEFGLRFFSRKWVEDEDLASYDCYVPAGQICGYCQEDDGDHCGDLWSQSQHHHYLVIWLDDAGTNGIGITYKSGCTCPTCHPERER